MESPTFAICSFLSRDNEGYDDDDDDDDGDDDDDDNGVVVNDKVISKLSLDELINISLRSKLIILICCYFLVVALLLLLLLLRKTSRDVSISLLTTSS